MFCPWVAIRVGSGVMPMPNATALVTGASSGIGQCLAREFAANGYALVLVARRAAVLEQLATQLRDASGVAVRVITADLAKAGAASEIYERCMREGIAVDVLVNNAGVGLQGAFAELPTERQLELVQINVTALTELTRLFLPAMLKKNSGGVLNVGSTAGFQPGAFMAVYYATKAYVVSFTEALAEEVSESRLRVSCLAPGPTATGFAEGAQMTHSRLFNLGTTMSAGDVARIGYAGWNSGRVLIVPGVTNKVGTALLRVTPRRWVRSIVKRLNT
jgi:uncharacterized protein